MEQQIMTKRRTTTAEELLALMPSAESWRSSVSGLTGGTGCPTTSYTCAAAGRQVSGWTVLISWVRGRIDMPYRERHDSLDVCRGLNDRRYRVLYTSLDVCASGMAGGTGYSIHLLTCVQAEWPEVPGTLYTFWRVCKRNGRRYRVLYTSLDVCTSGLIRYPFDHPLTSWII